MFEKILNRFQYVRDLRTENECLKTAHGNVFQKNKEILMEDFRIKNENKDLRRMIGFLLNEPHIVMEDEKGRYVPLDQRLLEKYQEVKVEKVQIPPHNQVRIYAKNRKENLH